jgi:cell division protease FtsH
MPAERPTSRFNPRGGDRRGQRPRVQRGPSSLWWGLGFLMLLGLAQLYFLAPAGRVISYSEFKKLLRDGQIAEITVGDQVIHGTLKGADEKTKNFTTNRVEDPKLTEELDAKDVTYKGDVVNRWLPDLLGWVIPLIIFIGIWGFFFRRMGSAEGGVMSFARSRAKIYADDEVKVRFSDVAGVDEAEEELKEIVEFLKNPKKYTNLGGRIPKGVLLVGPPGTGKTLLARAVAGEAHVPFFSLSGSEFVEMFVGVGAARIRDLFQQAEAKAPCIVFIDELDALGKVRVQSPLGSHEEREQTLNQLLAEMDGFDARKGVIIMGATNRPEVLDPALLRPGRFDRQVLVDKPDIKGREAILRIHVKGVKTADDVRLNVIAAQTAGFAGADIANLVNEAALLATRRGADAVTIEDFNVAIERIVAGLEKRQRVLNRQERRVVAHHELGHAVVAMALPGTDPVHKVSIIPRGVGALGYTIQRPTEDRFLMTREELENKMAVLLGGRAAEDVVFGHTSTGAADDLAKVTDIARSMVMRYAMVGSLGHVSYEEERPPFLGGPLPQGHREYSEATAREIDVAVREVVEAVYQKARGILVREKAILERWAERLLEKETLGEAELAEIGRAVAPA